MITGGGHTNYAGNEIYGFSIDSGTCGAWSIIKHGASTYDDSDVQYPFYKNGGSVVDSQQPRMAHYYDGIDYDSINDHFYMIGMYSSYSHATTYLQVRYLNVSDTTWHYQDPLITSIAGGNVSAMDPTTNRLWFYGDVSQGRANSLNPATGVMRNHCNIFCNSTIANYATGEIFPPVNRFIYIGSGESHYNKLDSTSGNNIDSTLTLSLTNCATLLAGKAPGLVYVPTKRRLYGWVSGTHVYAMDSTYTCTDIAPAASNTITPSSPSAQGTYGRAFYIPKYGLIGVVNSTTSNVFYYRVAAQTSSSGGSRTTLLGVGK